MAEMPQATYRRAQGVLRQSRTQRVLTRIGLFVLVLACAYTCVHPQPAPPAPRGPAGSSPALPPLPTTGDAAPQLPSAPAVANAPTHGLPSTLARFQHPRRYALRTCSASRLNRSHQLRQIHPDAIFRFTQVF